MGVAVDMESELIRVTVIDYFTGEKLIDSLVFPDIEIKHFNTRFSGVTPNQMRVSRKKGQCFMGGAAARAAVFKFVGPSTIVVGHSVGNDLGSLRWIHHRVVDTHTLESARRKKEEAEKEKERAMKKAEEEKEKALKGAEEKSSETENPLASIGSNANDKKGEYSTGQPAPHLQGNANGKNKPKVKYHPDGASLKALTMKYLGRDIQTGGKAGHDSFEDALATRDLLHFFITNRF
jgi:DNA polymerase III epsilon subunit-like protein